MKLSEIQTPEDQRRHLLDAAAILYGGEPPPSRVEATAGVLYPGDGSGPQFMEVGISRREPSPADE